MPLDGTCEPLEPSYPMWGYLPDSRGARQAATLPPFSPFQIYFADVQRFYSFRRIAWVANDGARTAFKVVQSTQYLALTIAMSRPGIVIVGPERAGKRTLIAGLQQLNGPDATTGATVG